MLVVTGTVEVPLVGVERMKEAAREMARKTRTEQGCITYAFWQDLEDDSRFRVYEEWVDRAALAAHFEAPHMATFRAVLGEIGLSARNIVSFDAGEVTPV